MTKIEPGIVIKFGNVDCTVLTHPREGKFKALQDLPNGRSKVVEVDLPTDQGRANCSG